MADAPQKPADTPPIAPPTSEAPAPVVPTPVAPQESEETKRLREENSLLKFDKEIGDLAKVYTRAPEFAEQIKAVMKEKGYSPTDAALTVLHANNALVAPPTAPPAAPQRPNSTRGAGGSMDNPPPRDQADPVPGSPGSAEFYANRLQELERKGEIFMT